MDNSLGNTAKLLPHAGSFVGGRVSSVNSGNRADMDIALHGQKALTIKEFASLLLQHRADPVLKTRVGQARVVGLDEYITLSNDDRMPDPTIQTGIIESAFSTEGLMPIQIVSRKHFSRFRHMPEIAPKVEFKDDWISVRGAKVVNEDGTPANSDAIIDALRAAFSNDLEMVDSFLTEKLLPESLYVNDLRETQDILDDVSVGQQDKLLKRTAKFSDKWLAKQNKIGRLDMLKQEVPNKLLKHPQDGKEGMFVVKNDFAPATRFVGRQIADVQRLNEDYELLEPISGDSPVRSTDKQLRDNTSRMALYKLNNDQYACVEQVRSSQIPDYGKNYAKLCDTIAQVREFFEKSENYALLNVFAEQVKQSTKNEIMLETQSAALSSSSSAMAL